MDHPPLLVHGARKLRVPGLGYLLRILLERLLDAQVIARRYLTGSQRRQEPEEVGQHERVRVLSSLGLQELILALLGHLDHLVGDQRFDQLLRVIHVRRIVVRGAHIVLNLLSRDTQRRLGRV